MTTTQCCSSQKKLGQASSHSYHEDIKWLLNLRHFRTSEASKSWEHCGQAETKWPLRQECLPSCVSVGWFLSNSASYHPPQGSRVLLLELGNRAVLGKNNKQRHMAYFQMPHCFNTEWWESERDWSIRSVIAQGVETLEHMQGLSEWVIHRQVSDQCAVRVGHGKVIIWRLVSSKHWAKEEGEQKQGECSCPHNLWLAAVCSRTLPTTLLWPGSLL